MAGGGGSSTITSARSSACVSSSTCCWYIAPTIDSRALITVSESRAGSSLGGISLASSPTTVSRIGPRLARCTNCWRTRTVRRRLRSSARRWRRRRPRGPRSAGRAGRRLRRTALRSRRSCRTSRRASARSTSPCGGRRCRSARPSGAASPAGRSRPARVLLLGRLTAAGGDERAERGGQPAGLQQLAAVDAGRARGAVVIVQPRSPGRRLEGPGVVHEQGVEVFAEACGVGQHGAAGGPRR